MCIDNDRDTKLADFISDDSYDADPSYACYMKEFRYHYNKMDGVINERERLIINMRYGFDGEKKSAFAEIGRHLGITQERAQQLEAKAILKLRRTEDFKEVQSFFEESIFEVSLQTHLFFELKYSFKRVISQQKNPKVLVNSGIFGLWYYYIPLPQNACCRTCTSDSRVSQRSSSLIFP